MSYQLSIHEKAAIESVFAMHYGRDLAAIPELVRIEEADPPNGETQAFNLDFALWFTTKPFNGMDRKSVVCGVIPNNIGPDFYLTVETGSLTLLRTEGLCLSAAPLDSYEQYIKDVQPWLHRCLSDVDGIEGDKVSAAAWESLRRCVSDFSKFDMLRLMIIGDRMCFYGQIGDRAIVRAMSEVRTYQEAERCLSIRAADGRTLAIDGFARVPVTRTKDAVAWIWDEGSRS